jgi:DNA-binding beta-propeller fold protein YncE
MSRAALVSTLLLVAACGDNLAVAPDAGHTDGAGGDAAVASRAVVVAGDFNSTGILSVLDVPHLTISPNAVHGVAGDDPYLRKVGGELFIVNRDKGNNVTVLDASTLALVEQLATGAGSNPQDVAVHGAKLYVPALGTAGVVVLTRGTATSKTISLASLDPDGKPDCISAYTVGDKVYVACGLLDGSFTPRGVGKVAVIDTATDTVTATLDLPFANPQGLFVATPAGSHLGGDLLIATAPSFTDYATGCVARITPGATPKANGCAITNLAADGFPAHMDVDASAAILWIAMTHYDASFNATGALRGYDLATGELWAAPISKAGQLIVDVAACPDGKVVVLDHTKDLDGIRVYTAASEVTTTPVAIGLPPGFGNGVACY